MKTSCSMISLTKSPLFIVSNRIKLFSGIDFFLFKILLIPILGFVNTFLLRLVYSWVEFLFFSIALCFGCIGNLSLFFIQETSLVDFILSILIDFFLFMKNSEFLEFMSELFSAFIGLFILMFKFYWLCINDGSLASLF